MDFNVDLFVYINQFMPNPAFDMIMPTITHFGGFIWLVLIVLAIVIYARITGRQTLKRVATLALVALLFSDLITYVLKHVVHEPRPFMSLDNVRLLISESDPCSFPSGHSTSTLAVVSVFLLNMYDLAGERSWIWDILLALFAVTIVFSRIYVGVHYPNDVLAGALIGIFGAVVVNRYKDRILELTERII